MGLEYVYDELGVFAYWLTRALFFGTVHACTSAGYATQRAVMGRGEILYDIKGGRLDSSLSSRGAICDEPRAMKEIDDGTLV